MVRYWQRRREPGWRHKIAINAVGASATGLVTLIVIWTKFAEGAWLVTVAIPLFVLAMLGVRRHYTRLARRLAAGAAAVVATPTVRNTTLILVEELDAAAERALWFARQISRGAVRALHVPRRGTDPGIRPRWFHVAGTEPLLEVLAPDAGPVDAVLEQVWRLPRGESDFVTVVVPELFPDATLVAQGRRPLELLLKLRLLSEPGLVVADVAGVESRDEPEPQRLVVRVLVSSVHAASMRAVNYARALELEDTKAVHFAFSADDARELRREWSLHGPRIPLEVDEAPYRDIGKPLLRYLRDLTADEGTYVLVLMPELVTRGWRRLLHNQRSLYIKRLLLFEPGVILASVPYQILR
jgi:hypothetical protein